jgi:hypothetical protein
LKRTLPSGYGPGRAAYGPISENYRQYKISEEGHYAILQRKATLGRYPDREISTGQIPGEWAQGRCQVACRERKGTSVSVIVKPRRLRSAVWSPPQREACGRRRVGVASDVELLHLALPPARPLMRILSSIVPPVARAHAGVRLQTRIRQTDSNCSG